MNNKYNTLINYIIKIGNDIYKKDLKIISNDQKDIKLNVDHEIHKKIIKFLKSNFPYKILSEEDELEIGYQNLTEPLWIVDPIDGSFNLYRNIPINCISIALLIDKKVTFALIYDFNKNEVFTIINQISYLNNCQIYTSDNKYPADSVLCTGFPSWRNYNKKSINLFLNQINKWKKIRAIGSAAISLTWVARGWVDAYIEEDIRIWDVIAGLAIVKASGGQILIKNNKRKNFVTAIATNGKILIEELL